MSLFHTSATILSALLLFTPSADPRPIPIIDGDAQAATEKVNKKQSDLLVIRNTLKRLTESVGFSSRASERVATEILWELCRSPRGPLTPFAVQATLNWGASTADNDEGESIQSLIAQLPQDETTVLMKELLDNHALPADEQKELYVQPALYALGDEPVGSEESISPAMVRDFALTLSKEEPEMKEFVAGTIRGDLAALAAAFRKIPGNCHFEGLYKVMHIATVCFLSRPSTTERLSLLCDILDHAAQDTKMPHGSFDEINKVYDSHYTGPLGQCIAAAVIMDPQQPLLHRIATLIPHEYASGVTVPSFQLLITSLVRQGHNINTVNSDKKTALDVIIDAAMGRKKESEGSNETAIYRRPTTTLSKNLKDSKLRTNLTKVATFLIEHGARHGLGYLRNTKRQHPLSVEAAQRTARFLCNTPHTSLVDALLSHDDELLTANLEAVSQPEVLTSLLHAAVASGNAATLRQLTHLGANIKEYASLLWGALVSPLHGENYLDDAQELVALGIPLNKRDALGNTALHTAVAAANKTGVDSALWELVGFLIKNGASMNARNARGETPLGMANYALQKFMRGGSQA